MLNRLDVDKATLIAIAEADQMFSDLLEAYEGVEDGEIEEGLYELVGGGGRPDEAEGLEPQPGPTLLQTTQGA